MIRSPPPRYYINNEKASHDPVFSVQSRERGVEVRDPETGKTEEDPACCSSQICTFTEETTFHGLSRINPTRNKIRR